MKPRSNTRPLSGTRSVLRAVSVLKTLGRSASAYGITELGTATGLSKATVFRLLGALDLSEGLETLVPPAPSSPVALLKAQGKERRRASRPRGPAQPEKPWSWRE